MHTRAPSASLGRRRPAAARSGRRGRADPVGAGRGAVNLALAQWHGSHENDLIGVQHFTPNQPFGNGYLVGTHVAVEP